LYATKPKYSFKKSTPFEEFYSILVSLSSTGVNNLRLNVPHLKENKFGGIASAPNTKFDNVIALALPFCDLTDDQLVGLIQMFPNLLYFEYSVYIEPNSNEEPKKVSARSFQALATQTEQTELRGLSLCHPCLSESLFSAFQKQYANLQFLSLTHTFFLEDSAWQQLFSSLKNLNTLHLGYSTIDDKSLAHLFDNTALCQNIHDFRLVAVQHVSDGIYSKFGVFKSLDSLEVSLNNKFVNEQVVTVANEIPRLRRFKSQNYQGTGENSFKHFKNLEELVLHDSDRLTDKAMKDIATLVFLQHLDINNCSHLTQASLDSLASCPSLRYLDIRFCSGISKNINIPKKMKGKDFLLVQKNSDLIKKGGAETCPCSLKSCCFFEKNNLSLVYH